MARFDERSGQLYVTELGRVASHFYIRHASIVAFNEKLKPHMGEAEVRSMPHMLITRRIMPVVEAGRDPQSLCAICSACHRLWHAWLPDTSDFLCCMQHAHLHVATTTQSYDYPPG